MNKMLSAIKEHEKIVAAVSEEEVTLFLESVSGCIDLRIAELDKINFSRGYELDRCIYPSVEEFKPIAFWLDSLDKKYKIYKKKRDLLLNFRKYFSLF